MKNIIYFLSPNIAIIILIVALALFPIGVDCKVINFNTNYLEATGQSRTINALNTAVKEYETRPNNNYPILPIRVSPEELKSMIDVDNITHTNFKMKNVHLKDINRCQEIKKIKYEISTGDSIVKLLKIFRDELKLSSWYFDSEIGIIYFLDDNRNLISFNLQKRSKTIRVHSCDGKGLLNSILLRSTINKIAKSFSEGT